MNATFNFLRKKDRNIKSYIYAKHFTCLFTCQYAEPVDVLFKHRKGIFDGLSGGHVDARGFVNIHGRHRRARFEEVDVILCRAGDSIEDAFGDGVCGGDADGILEGVVVDVEMGGKCTPGYADTVAV